MAADVGASHHPRSPFVPPSTPAASRAAAPDGSPPVTLHVDLDGAQDIYEGHGWGWPSADDPLFETGMRHFLDFFGENGVRATLFVIARSVRDPRKRPLIDEAVRAGHEIASHSLTHRYLTQLDTAGKRTEIGDSKALLEDTLGVPVHGFRAPGYRIDRESLELLAQYGYTWDSSVFPTAHYERLVGLPVSVLGSPHEPVSGSDFVEWPMPDHRPFPIPFNPSYTLLLGDWLFRGGIRRFQKSGRGLSLLFHLIDLADPMPRERLRGFTSKIFTLSTLDARTKRRRCQAMLDLARRHYRLMTTGEAIAQWRANRGAHALPAVASSPASGTQASGRDA
jgi:peptidoglycan/xylan/chitin deacetylase (PgdA/CDA1 family)